MRERLESLLAGVVGACLVAAALGLFVRDVDAAYLPVPSGAFAYFDRTTATGCPNGWTEFTNARGAYVVGLVNGGTLNTLVGTALSNQEDRAVGQHTHTITDPGHTHGITDPGHTHTGVATVGSKAYGADTITPYAAAGSTGSSTTGITINSATTGISINNAGSVASTNAPYLQLLVCSKS